jgi:hypothetical protein
MAPDGELAAGDFVQPRTVEPSPKQGVALARSLGGIYGLMNIATGEIVPLQIPENVQPQLTTTYPNIHNASQSDFMLLASGPEAVWLVDLTSGDALNLAELQEEPSFIDSASISPDGRWAIYSWQSEGILISLETAGEPKTIDPDPILPFPIFDAESNVVYGAGESGSVAIRRLDPETGDRTEVINAPDVRVLPLHLGDPLLLLSDESVLILGEGDTAPRELFTWSDGSPAVLMDLDGTHLLIRDEQHNIDTWHWVDIATGSDVEVAELEAMTPILTTTRRDAVTFAPSVSVGPGVVGAPYRIFDLNRGTVSTVLEQDSDDVYRAFPAGDASGRYTLVNAVSPGSGRIWLIDNESGSATQIAASPGNADARVSPDGCQLALAIYDTVGEGRTSAITVTSLIDGSTSLTVPDAILLGWANVANNAQRLDS